MINLKLYKTFHKLIVVEFSNGKIQILPIYKSLAYTVWCYKHIADFEVIASIKGNDSVVQELCSPLAILSSRNDVVELMGKISNSTNIDMVYCGTPTTPPLLPRELLYKDETDNFNRLFPEDIATIMKLQFTDNVILVNTEFLNIIKDMSVGTHTVYNANEYSYFQTFIIVVSLIGGIPNQVPKYRESLPNRYTLKDVIGKAKKHSLFKYITRSKYLNNIRESNKEYKTTANTSVQVDTAFILPTPIREYYESLICKYVSHLSDINLTVKYN